MRTLEQRMAILEKLVADIHSVIVQDKQPTRPGIRDYRRAMDAMVQGDMEPLQIFLKRGGQVPDPEMAFPGKVGRQARNGG